MKRIEAFFIGAIFGAAVGAIVALIFAPLSGEEMRARIGQEAQAEREKLQGGYQQARQQVEGRIETMRHHQDVESESEEAVQAAVEG